MGTHLFLFATPLVLHSFAPKPSITISRPFSGCHRGPIPIHRLRFSLWDNAEYDDDDDDEFGFGSATKTRNWWSDDDLELDDDDDGDEFSIFTALKAFGWMVPAVVLSFVLGTGPNAFLMALAVPLGQTAISLVFDKVWGRTVNSPKPRRKTKSKKKPFTRRPRESSRGRGNSQSWSAAAGKSSGSTNDKKVTGFGGWDELDNQVWTDSVKASPKAQKGSKLSKRGKVKETPLLLRLLVAVFPFMGSWAKLLL